MEKLPLAFTEQTRQLMGEALFGRYLKSFEEQPPVSIRLNPRKTEGMQVAGGEPVPWCRQGWYLPQRPNFTMDPLLHAGCYYVQEAASMFLDEVLRQVAVSCWPSAVSQEPKAKGQKPKANGLTALDLCAAPGGKSTLLRTALPDDCVLYSNEPVRTRANILAENVQKWGHENHIVTNLYPRDYRTSKSRFDIILCDVPCSGEGMFRKDEATIREWSPQQVEKCWQLQRDIVSDAWACLNDGGLLIYSTCTFNTKENEENVRWILSEYDAEAVSIETRPEWNITGSLLPGFSAPVYRFIPGISRGEGLFMCVLRKGKTGLLSAENSHAGNKKFPSWEKNIPMLGINSQNGSPFSVELSYQQAIAYLRGEALVLPADTPRGLAEVTFMGQTLGQVKNIGNRANNLYPKPWRIKTTHTANEYEPILIKI